MHAIQENLLIVSTGSQGEPSSGLDKLANCVHKYLKLRKDDMVIFSARVILGNEVEVNRIKNQLVNMGVEILDVSMDSSIHVSGHPSQVEIEEMLSYVKPKHLIPVHGDPMRLKEMSRIATRNNIISIIPKNGTVLKLDQKLERIGEVETDIMCVDGLYPVSINDQLFVERSDLSENGIIILIKDKDKVHFQTFGINKACHKSLAVFLEKNKHDWSNIDKPVHFFFYKYYGKIPKVVSYGI